MSKFDKCELTCRLTKKGIVRYANDPLAIAARMSHFM